MVKCKNRWLGLVLAIAIAFSTLVPFFASYNHGTTPVAAPSQLSSIFGEKILICTGDGFALVSLKDLLAGKTPNPHKSYACALCYVAANAIGKLLLLAVAFVFFWRKRAGNPSLLSLYYRVILKSLAHNASRPRAPPLSFCH